jgi:succinate dehydrogenase / fumarate reductase cytochrome b subunit
MSTAKKRRPVFFNLLQIDMPVTAVVSFAHRVSGVILALCVPLLLYLLQSSLRSPEDYARVAGLFANPLARAATAILLWAFAHHLLAGIRHLLFDIDIGVGRHAGRISAWTVLLSEFGLVALVLWVFL